MTSDKTQKISSDAEPLRVAHALKPGDSIMEYVIERTLGGGGFGITYLARDNNLNLPVAIKEYLPGDLALRSADDSVHALGDAFEDDFKWGLERFLDEARVLATFRHPNIVRVLRYFIVNGTGYIVMEYESGVSLKQWLPRQEDLTQASVLDLLFPLLDGLEVIHAANFLHRDIKPDNIYVRDDGTPVLIDFGSARSIETDRELTNVVSPGFAPFEQYHGKGHQGPWTDLYSLAAVMYWVVSGNKPLDSLSRLKSDSMLPATQFDTRGRFDVAVLKAIDWALDPDETRRPQSVAEFKKRLQEAPGTVAESSITQRPAAQHLSAGEISGTYASASDVSGRNVVCSILFLDLVAYSQTSVNAQFELKSVFNDLVAEKLAHIPESTRITLDTGDGAAICFMGDPEEVMHASFAILDVLLQQRRLQVRMGLHIGPVRIINDLNGHSNVIGDGINVAQRVMSFADSNSLVVSRAFYEIVARLTDRSAHAFEYLGKRRDKHDRAHELYVVSSHGDKTVAFNGIADDKTVRFDEAGQGDDGACIDLGAADALPSGTASLWGRARTLVGRYARRAKSAVNDMYRRAGKWLEEKHPGWITVVQRIWAGAREAAYQMYLCHAADHCGVKRYWWKLAVATSLSYGIAWGIGDVVWGLGAGLLVFVAGWLNYLRLMNGCYAQSEPDAAGRAWLFSPARWTRQDMRANLILVAPSILMVLVLWTSLPDSVHSRSEKPNALERFFANLVKPASAEDDAEARENLHKAKQMLAAKKYEKAISLSNAVLKKYPDTAEAKKIIKQANEAKKSHWSLSDLFSGGN